MPSSSSKTLSRRQVVSTGALVPLAACATTGTNRGEPVRGRRGAITAGGRTGLAADAGHGALADGGNAADAAAAALLALTVEDAPDFCFGGEVAMLVHKPGLAEPEVLGGVGAAPALATIDAFADGGMPEGGDARTALVPGAFGAVLTLLERHGTFTFDRASAPMRAALARGSERWHADLARTLDVLVRAERGAPGRTQGLSAVAEAFYRGPIAEALDAWSRTHGGLLRAQDLAAHATSIERAVGVEFGGHTVWKCGAFTQGPFLLATLRLLEGYDLAALGPGSADAVHLAVEAMKLAFADRDEYLGDPKVVDVPLDALVSRAYADARRGLIDRAHASRERRPGDPRRGVARLAQATTFVAPRRVGKSHDTTTCIAADASGGFVVATPSGWGGVLAGDTGVWLGSRLRSLNLISGHPNALAPGKRPRVTLTPTLLTRGKEPVLGISVAGGDYQDQVALQILLNRLVFGRDLADAVAAPRFGTDHLVTSFNQKPPELGSVALDERLPESLVQALAARGHAVKRLPAPVWQPTALERDPATGALLAAGDPRAGRRARAL